MSYASMPQEIKSMFQSLANKGDWTAEEAFDHLVPDQLQDDPQHVEVWMNGGEITVAREVGDRGIAGGGYTETETITMPDRDCSRIEAGGEYSVENTIMEDMSANRSRGDVDITPEELDEIRSASESEARLIEEMLPEVDVHTVLEDLEEVADGALLGEAAEIAGGFMEVTIDFLAPVIGGGMAAKAVADRCEKPIDKVGWGSLVGGGTTLALMTPPGQIAIGGYLAWKVGKRAHGMWKRHQARQK